MTLFYPVITSRDYLKSENKKCYLWELLDNQPKGFLTALGRSTNRVIPQSYHVIYDCGAWSYRNNESPPIDAQKAIVQYDSIAKQGDIVAAPDHMLLPGTNIDDRRFFNRREATNFIKFVGNRFIPMGTIHGLDLKEQIEYGKFLTQELGFEYIAVGGLAARSRQKSFVVNSVAAIKQSFPDANIHVFGISAPNYVKVWKELEITSFDGSSYFLKALTKGIYLDHDLIEYKIKNLQMGEIPICNCAACLYVRKQNEDTRMFGNSLRNIGRAIHNLNMLMGVLECI